MVSRPIIKKIFLPFTIGIFSTCLLLASYFRLLERFELVILDYRYNLRPAPCENKNIVLIEISEDSLNALARWPLPRDYHASLIDVLNQAGARMVIFDILFSEPTGWDGILAESAQRYGRVYFPFAFTIDEGRQKGILNAKGVDAPLLKSLNQASAGSGFINKIVDIDGKVRKIPLLINFEDRFHPQLALKAACDYLNIPIEQMRFDPTGCIKIDNRFVIPTDSQGAVLLNFVGRWVDSFTHYSYLDILAAFYESKKEQTPRIDLGQLKDKICFVGLTAAGTHELGPIPLEKSYPMMGIHANLFNMIIEGIYLKRLSRWQNLLILIILSILCFLLIFRAKPLYAFMITVCFTSLISILSFLLFAFAGMWIDVVCPAITLIVIYLGVSLTRYIAEIKKRLQVEKELSIARSIQQSFLPEEIPRIEGLDIAWGLITATEIGGDLYDFINLDKGTLGIIVGDVSGKGIPAALFMARVGTLFKIFAKGQSSPSEVLKKMNEELSRDYRSGLFVTLFYAIFDKNKRTVIFSSAGHPPVAILRSHNSNIEQIQHEEGMPAGIMEDIGFSDKETVLSGGDVVVLYTDGVTEAMDIKRHEFGIDGLTKSLRDTMNVPAQQILKTLLDNIKGFQGKAEQHDDITAVVIKVKDVL